MEWKDLINRNFSRKAELVVVTHAAIVLLARIEGVEAGVLRLAMIICGVVGFAGLVVQGLIDYVHPRPKGPQLDYEKLVARLIETEPKPDSSIINNQ